jgi:thiol-disulfide isomerase/thioredoxin
MLYCILNYENYCMKKVLTWFAITIALASCTKSQNSSDAEQAQQNDLPSIRLTFSDGKKLSGRELPGNSVLVLFQPDCDHCQREAEQIAAFSKSFERYSVYFISSAPVADVVEFGKKYNLTGKSNFFFAETSVDDVLNSFGPIETPSLYIYSDDRKLIQSFNGEVAMEVVVKYL